MVMTLHLKSLKFIVLDKNFKIIRVKGRILNRCMTLMIGNIYCFYIVLLMKFLERSLLLFLKMVFCKQKNKRWLVYMCYLNQPPVPDKNSSPQSI